MRARVIGLGQAAAGDDGVGLAVLDALRARGVPADVELVRATEDVALGDEELRLRCEQAVRSYDPCISCATHFLRLEVDRAPSAPATAGAATPRPRGRRR